MVKQFILTYEWDLVAMVIKVHSTFPKCKGQVPHHQIQFSVNSISETLTDTNFLGQIGFCSNGNEGVHHIPQSSRTEASPSVSISSHTYE